MARIFSINFDFEGEQCSAMVTVRNTPFFTEYSLLLDAELTDQLPGTKIISTPSNAFVFANATFDETTPLMLTILNAVRVHVESITI